MTDEEYRCFDAFIGERAKGKPLQYITGHQEFMGLDFVVSPDVLIPRQDTKALVETVLNYVEDTESKKTEILDIGTGSGCIAISLAAYIKNCRVVACDVSEKALNVARTNAQRCGVENRVDFICGDILQGLDKILCQSTFMKDKRSMTLRFLTLLFPIRRTYLHGKYKPFISRLRTMSRSCIEWGRGRS